MGKLDGKVAITTGATSGMGRATAKRVFTLININQYKGYSFFISFSSFSALLL